MVFFLDTRSALAFAYLITQEGKVLIYELINISLP